MLRRSKKGIAILALLAMLMTVLPVASFAASNTEPLSKPYVDDDTVTKLGAIVMEITAGKIENGESATFRLPEGFEFRNADGTVMDDDDWASTVADDVYDTTKIGNGYNYFLFPDEYEGDANGLVSGGVDLDVTMLDDNELKITFDGEPTSGQKCFMYLYMNKIYVDSGFDGDITLIVDSKEDCVPTGSTTVGVVTGGAVDVEVTNVPTFTNDADEDDGLKFRIDEDTAGALEPEDESVKLVLPNGFEFTGEAEVKIIYGEAEEDGTAIDDLATYLEKCINIDADELTLDLPDEFESTEAITMEITVNYEVEDETDAKTGEVKAKVSGESDISQNEVVVGHYGQYDVSIAAGDAPTIVAGMLEQSVAKLTIKESVKDSLTDGRTLILTLPSNAKWGKMDEDSDSSVDIDFVGFPGKDGKAAKWEFSTKDGSSDAAELVLDDLEVVLEPGFEGDLVAQASGTAGLKGDLVLGKEVKAVEIKADSKPIIGIGQGAQDTSDLIITEAQAGAITDGVDLELDLPEGVSWSGTPKVEVTEGDLDIDEDGITKKADNSDDNRLVIPIDDKSSTASTIKVSGIKITINRSVPEGDIPVKVKGDAVGEVNNESEVEDYLDIDDSDYAVISNQQAFKVKDDGEIFPETSTAASTILATVGTDGEKSAEVKFVIGSTTYTLNGKEATMDVAPYLKNGRTYLPIRYVGTALGVADDNIVWDGASATLIKGDKVVQVTPGSKIMKVNGAAIAMDVAAENTSGRIMLPFRWIAQAFGAEVAWDEATQTVTMKN